MALTISPELEKRIQIEQHLGGFESTEDLLASAIDVLQTQQGMAELRALQASFEAKLGPSLSEADRREVLSAEEFERNLDAWFAERVG